tara:strand:+ start:128 stop:574 length:447 start_codon:yes stop_codon:yes gene_type:complete
MANLKELDILDADVLKDDPVRPHISKADRLSDGRQVFVLENDGKIAAVICVAYTNAIPKDEFELAAYNAFDGTCAIFYTVWSYEKGAGREIIQKVSDHLTKRGWIKRFVTLSPLTETAEKFHLRNGAELIYRGKTCQNFEYFMEAEHV